MLRLSCPLLGLSQCQCGLALPKHHIQGVQHRGLAGAGLLTAIPMQDLGPSSYPLAPLTSAGLLLLSSVRLPAFATWLHCSLCTSGPFPEEHASHAALTLPPKLSPRLPVHKLREPGLLHGVNLAVCLPAHIGYSLGFASKQALTCLLCCKDGVKTWREKLRLG